jgi:hypothetical protein
MVVNGEIKLNMRNAGVAQSAEAMDFNVFYHGSDTTGK